MNRTRHSPVIRLIASVAILTCLCAGTLLTGRAHAQVDRSTALFGRVPVNDSSDSLNREWTQGDKLSPDLREEVDRTCGGGDISTTSAKDRMVRVVVQLKPQPGSETSTFLSGGRVVEKRRLANFNARGGEIGISAINSLASLRDVGYISIDRDIQMLGHVETASGAAAMRQLSGNGGFDGSGIGIAVLDSGLDKDHDSFKGRVAASVDFTGAGKTEDSYGHGTHVAGLAAGDDSLSHGGYAAVENIAKVVILRVLDSHGKGTTSAVMGALDWVITNRAKYNIRVVNMSLGALAIDSYINDPLCRPIRRLVDAGIVCVAAAGNNGKDSNGNKVYGLIHSPGNEPSAITVGATNTYGTDARSDDTIATFSSRGPTRSYVKDALGNKHYDNLIKPDLVAPGNRLYSAESYTNGGDTRNYLVTANPQLDCPGINDEQKDMMMLSGTSMATPIVAGAA